jgi:hypothetical protein
MNTIVPVGDRWSFVHRQGDFCIGGRWIPTGDPDAPPEPALVIWERLAVRPVSCIIALSVACKYADPRYLLEAAVTMANAMHLAVTQSTIFRIADMVRDHLPDLINIPPAPVIGTNFLAEVTTTVDGHRTTQDWVEEERCG